MRSRPGTLNQFAAALADTVNQILESGTVSSGPGAAAGSGVVHLRCLVRRRLQHSGGQSGHHGLPVGARRFLRQRQRKCQSDRGALETRPWRNWAE